MLLSFLVAISYTNKVVIIEKIIKVRIKETTGTAPPMAAPGLVGPSVVSTT